MYIVFGLLSVARAAQLSDVGALQVLHYNDLAATNNGTTAILLRSNQSYANAQTACAAIGESLYQLNATNQTQIGLQLQYLVYNGDLPQNGSVWVGSNECSALAYGNASTSMIACDSLLPALCTSGVGPTTDFSLSPANGSLLTVSSSNYTYTGYRDSRSFRFLGIPFAAPPLGEYRFLAPQAYNGSKVINATAWGDQCIQSSSPYGSLNGTNISEDCLTLNVYTPFLPNSTNSTNLRSVAFYMYGGSFEEGGSGVTDYDGGNFASRNDVVIVTSNYRLGPLGYLASKTLDGNYGIADQIAALKWIQTHIADFGGNPKNVSIFGQSAGGQSVVALLSSSAAKDLFTAAIVQSAPVDLPWLTRQVYTDIITPAVAYNLGCRNNNETELVQCLRAVPATSFLLNSTALSNETDVAAEGVAKYLDTTSSISSIEPFLPIVGDNSSGIIDGQFDKLLKNGSLPNKVPTMFSTTLNEGALFVDGAIGNLSNQQSTFDAALPIAFPMNLAQSLTNSTYFNVSSSDNDGVRDALAQVLTLSEWLCPEKYLLKNGGNSTFPAAWEVLLTNGHLQTTVGSPYVCSPNDVFNATCHTSDVLLVFGTLNSKVNYTDPYYNTNDVLHAQLLNDVWGSFFRTHDPNPSLEWLSVRGPAYASTLRVFNSTGFNITQYGTNTYNELGYPPTKSARPLVDQQCAVFDRYGYTFDRAGNT